MCRLIVFSILLYFALLIIPFKVGAKFETDFSQNVKVTILNNTEQDMLISFLADGCTDITIAITKNSSISHNHPRHPAHSWYSHPMSENPYRHCQVRILEPNQTTSYEYKGVGYTIETDRLIASYAFKNSIQKNLRNVTFTNYVYHENSQYTLPISTNTSQDTYLSITQDNPQNKLSTSILQLSP
ncbi:hypothetical protein [uncultured Shewanella sp.]|uniref:hypothetical protein n=1 Tax=uncultured Shewanella sp. TaxID=173975 RepID=UPI00263479D0|nr:hypothetical protein [uncultured Shewanella sp.]